MASSPPSTHHPSPFPAPVSTTNVIPTHPIPTMKCLILPFKRKFSSSTVARSDAGSLSSGSSSSSSSSADLKADTPKSVLRHANDTEEVFRLMDKDGDGKISRRELEAVFRRLGVGVPSEEELAVILDEADRDGDGCISLAEFGEVSSRLGPAGGGELREAFDYFDRDGDGKISAEELLGVFACIGDGACTIDDCRRMIVGVDSDGDGFVCFDDFARMMQLPSSQS